MPRLDAAARPPSVAAHDAVENPPQRSNADESGIRGVDAAALRPRGRTAYVVCSEPRRENALVGRPSLRKSGCECAASQRPDLPELEASSCFSGAWSPLLLAIDEPSVREPCAIAHLPDARRLVHLLLSEVHYEVGVPRPPAAAAFKYRVG